MKTRQEKTKRNRVWLVVHPETGKRLCRDFLWRNFALLGTGPGCVKFYKRLHNAEKRAMQCAHQDGKGKYVKGKCSQITKCIALYEGDALDAAGNVVRKS